MDIRTKNVIKTLMVLIVLSTMILNAQESQEHSNKKECGQVESFRRVETEELISVELAKKGGYPISDILTDQELLLLVQYIEKNIEYKYKLPVIEASVSLNCIKNTKIIELRDYLVSRETCPNITFCVNAAVGKVWKFGKFMSDNHDTDKFDFFYVDEVAAFNKMIEEENTRIDDCDACLDLLRLFYLLASTHYGTVQINFSRNELEILKNQNDKMRKVVEDNQEFFQNPICKAGKKAIVCGFSLGWFNNNRIRLGRFKMKVNQKGVVSPIWSKNLDVDL